jgi:hypothetical protein
MEAEYEDPYVLITDKKISSVDDFPEDFKVIIYTMPGFNGNPPDEERAQVHITRRGTDISDRYYHARMTHSLVLRRLMFELGAPIYLKVKIYHDVDFYDDHRVSGEFSEGSDYTYRLSCIDFREGPPRQ